MRLQVGLKSSPWFRATGESPGLADPPCSVDPDHRTITPFFGVDRGQRERRALHRLRQRRAARGLDDHHVALRSRDGRHESLRPLSFSLGATGGRSATRYWATSIRATGRPSRVTSATSLRVMPSPAVGVNLRVPLAAPVVKTVAR